ncbi:MAG TPA: APC family permease [Gemmataceae bacterium]|jgi:APA family basic amino acid/polyamine antiporter|nr:APC family permease [Gemmataceae bacterium]
MGNKEDNGGLLRALGPYTATAIVAGTVIGSGVFKKPQSIAASVPGFDLIALVWVLGGVLALLGALSLAEVAVLFPRAGGNYVYLREGYGRLAGFLWGWVEFWIIRAASIAALATIFIESLHDILRQTRGVDSNMDVLSFMERQFLTVGVIAVLAVVNIRGVRWGGGLQLFITTIKVASLLAILILPFALWSRIDRVETPSAARPDFSWGGLGTAFLGVLWSYHGWMNIAPVSGEVKNPQRNIPLAFLAGVGIVIFLYLGANLAYHLVIPQHEMAQLTGTTVVAEFARRLLGATGTVLASGVVMCSVFGALNGNLLVGPRVLFAMGEDGLAPKAIGATHARFRTPAVAIAVMGGWSIILILAAGALIQYPLPVWEVGTYVIDVNPPPDKPLFDMLTDFAMFGAVIFETLAVTTIFVFRRRLPGAPRPYRCLGYPLVPLLYLVLPAYILGSMFYGQRTEVAAGLGFIALGAVVYFGMGLYQVKGIRNEGHSVASRDSLE